MPVLIKPTNAEKIEAILAIARAHGKVGQPKPDWVVEAARDPDHILHSCFDWDKEKVFERALLDQARNLIRTVYYQITFYDKTFEPPLKSIEHMRAFEQEPIKPRGQQGYLQTLQPPPAADKCRQILKLKSLEVKRLVTAARIEAQAWRQEAYFEKLLAEIFGRPE